MKIIVIDNYDSFTYNLVHIIRALGHEPSVVKNDEITCEEVTAFDKILLSPGPGIPDEAGIMKEVIKRFGPQKSILGICLGHQGIAEVYGALLVNMPHVLHGVVTQTRVIKKDEYLFRETPDVFPCTHYHSWSVKPESIPDDLEVTAVNEDGIIMGISHKRFDVRGLQFHPESIMTKSGPQMIKNWIEHVKR